MKNPTIAVLDGRTIRKFINKMKLLGAVITIDRAVHKVITDSTGEKVFSALKYSTSWDCRISEIFLSDLKSCISGNASFKTKKALNLIIQ